MRGTALVAYFIGLLLGCIIGAAAVIQTGTWEDGAIGVYEHTIVCEKALSKWVCEREEEK